MERALRTVTSVLQSLLGDQVVHVKYGWGCELHPALCNIPMEVGTGWLGRFIDDSLRQKIVIPGESDLYIISPKGELSIVFCHEGHIHSGGNDPELEKKFWATPPFDEFSRP